MTCHLGYTLQQAAFAFLYLVAPIGLAARHCAPLDLLGDSAACSIAAGIYHAGLAVVCESPWASETVHGYWDVDSFARLRMACVARMIVSLTWSVSPCIIHGKGAFKAVRITALIGLVTANVCTVYWAWNTIGSVEHIIPKCLATFFMAGLLSWVSLLTEASSNAMMQRSTILLAGLQVTAAILRKVYSLDLNGRVTPYTAEDAAHPHWSAPLFFGLLDLAFFIAPTAAADVAKSQTQLRPAAPLPTLTLQRLQALPMKHILIIMLSFIVAWVAVVLPLVSSSITIHSRELLSTDSTNAEQDGVVPSWLLPCLLLVMLVVVVMVTIDRECDLQARLKIATARLARSRQAFWPTRPCPLSTPSSSNTQNSADRGSAHDCSVEERVVSALQRFNAAHPRGPVSISTLSSRTSIASPLFKGDDDGSSCSQRTDSLPPSEDSRCLEKSTWTLSGPASSLGPKGSTRPLSGSVSSFDSGVHS